jgi:hypothetical protein
MTCSRGGRSLSPTETDTGTPQAPATPAQVIMQIRTAC